MCLSIQTGSKYLQSRAALGISSSCLQNLGEGDKSQVVQISRVSWDIIQNRSGTSNSFGGENGEGLAEVPLEAAAAHEVKCTLTGVTSKGPHVTNSLPPYTPPWNHILFNEVTSSSPPWLYAHSLCLGNYSHPQPYHHLSYLNKYLWIIHNAPSQKDDELKQKQPLSSLGLESM